MKKTVKVVKKTMPVKGKKVPAAMAMKMNMKKGKKC